MTRAVVTGASGFVGRHLVSRLVRLGWRVDAIATDPSATAAALPALTDVSGWEPLPELKDVDVIFHLGGLAHANVEAPAERLQEVNVQRTIQLFCHAREAGVDQFVWLSSIKALGDVSREPLGTDAPTRPGDPYGQSKALGESALVAENPGTTVLNIVRPPLIYGPGVGANFLKLLKLAKRGWPLPLARANAPRSWLAVGNLVDFLVALTGADAARETVVWHVRDAEETPVATLLQHLGELFGRRVRLWAVPVNFAMRLGKLLGKESIVQRLFCPLQLDVTQTQQKLGWQPPISQQQALAEVVAWHQAQ